MKDRVWIAWEKQRRTIELSKMLSCELHLLDYMGYSRYLKCIASTFRILYKHRSSIIFVQNPSMVLAALACIFKKITRSVVVVDRHTTFRLGKSAEISLEYLVFKVFNRFTLQNADLTIVTNEELAKIVKNNKGNPFILPDKLPTIIRRREIKLIAKHNILLIASFAQDEPIIAAIEAMSKLKKYCKHEVTLYVSGNYKKLPESVIADVPDNIVFTGYLNDSDFENMLHAVDAIMVLTTAESCMLCGCYEAVAASKPLITSNKKVLKKYFSGCVFVENTSSGICDGIIQLFNNYSIYLENIVNLKTELNKTWSMLCEDLTNKLNLIVDKRANHEAFKN